MVGVKIRIKTKIKIKMRVRGRIRLDKVWVMSRVKIINNGLRWRWGIEMWIGMRYTVNMRMKKITKWIKAENDKKIKVQIRLKIEDERKG